MITEKTAVGNGTARAKTHTKAKTGYNIATYRSMLIPTSVKALRNTATACMYVTKGHMKDPKGQYGTNILATKVNGMQTMAFVISLTAKLRRKKLVAVRIRL
ncbi:hypothetical protein CHS0354_024325 [Potamilus streckersoni]|uniref:Uncharacterized protein n=1 Tax=Potamilus streckersoni TaxID=2493646 RepID=A0AAE0VGH0_9BIVA|nr:hypothetical protein CHS0354_024325 [Potamilus streckersoni]